MEENNNFNNSNYTLGEKRSLDNFTATQQPPVQQNQQLSDPLIPSQPIKPSFIQRFLIIAKTIKIKLLSFYHSVYTKFLSLALLPRITVILLIFGLLVSAILLLPNNLSKDPQKSLNQAIINTARQKDFKYEGNFTVTVADNYQNSDLLKNYLTLDAKHLTYSDEILSNFVEKATLSEITYPTDENSRPPTDYESIADPDTGTSESQLSQTSSSSSSIQSQSSISDNQASQSVASSASASSKKTVTSSKTTKSSTVVSGFGSDYLNWQEIPLTADVIDSSSSTDSSYSSISADYNSGVNTNVNYSSESQSYGFSVPVIFSGFYSKGGLNFSMQYLSNNGDERKIEIASENKSLLAKANFGNNSDKWVKYSQNGLKKESIFASLFNKKDKTKTSSKFIGVVRIEGEDCLQYHVDNLDVSFISENFGFNKNSIKKVSGEIYIAKKKKLLKKLKLTITTDNQAMPNIEGDITFKDYGVKNSFSMPQ